MTEHLPVVRIIAQHIYKRLPEQVEFDDLYSAGVLGLVEAATKFDPSKKISFRTYAPHRIRGAMLDSLRKLDWFPRSLRRNGRAVEQALQTLTAQYGRFPTDLEVADQLEIDLSAYQQLLGKLHGLQIISLGSRDSEDPGKEELDYISSRPEDDPLFCCLDAERREWLAKSIKKLPEPERMIIALHYYEELTLKEVGSILGIVESRVRQINAFTLLHLRALISTPSTIEASRKEKTPSAPVEQLRKTRHTARIRKCVRPSLCPDCCPDGSRAAC